VYAIEHAAFQESIEQQGVRHCSLKAARDTRLEQGHCSPFDNTLARH
jgi:hypothetical protein